MVKLGLCADTAFVLLLPMLPCVLDKASDAPVSVCAVGSDGCCTLLLSSAFAYPPMYPIVSGSTLSVHGDRLVASPASSTAAYVTGVISGEEGATV